MEDGESRRKRIAAFIIHVNGQKRNHETGAVTDDATKIWNWATIVE